MDRREKALAYLDTGARGLEIGPSYAPLVTKASGANIETVDHASRDELIEKFRSYGLPDEKIDQIEEVDYVWAGGSIAEVVGAPGQFDYILASHVIEHTVDLIGFLRDCESLLTDTGRVSLVVPDKRYSFDRFKPLTSVGDVIDGHMRPLRFHPPGALVDHHAYACTKDGQVAWWPGHGGRLRLQFDDVATAGEAVSMAMAQEAYQDVHRWTFTPSSFALLLQDLRTLGYHSLVEVGSYGTEGFEFFLTLGRGQDAPATDRLDLLLRIESELTEDVPTSDTAEPRERILELERANQQLSERLSARDQALAEMRASTSWRVTRPLRGLGPLLRRS